MREVTLSVQAINERPTVFIDGKHVDGKTDSGMTTWPGAPIPIGNGTRPVEVAVGLKPTRGDAVRTYTIDIVQHQPESCMVASGGRLAWSVEDCSRKCNSVYGGSAPLPTGNLDWALNEIDINELLEKMFKETAPIHPPFEELATRVDYLLTNYSRGQAADYDRHGVPETPSTMRTLCCPPATVFLTLWVQPHCYM